ncbi:uncharacterized protein LOC9642476 [Selaginella moellendorffii]|uniref:uncharacterized protein LOC9642476 n=1 Tax=Selaginella moellendorffii TaxID=88036 RepID=UPI000D1D044F|nr:uncharacterized protein LOC9642476 [Selaginella moellendorffii]|eukprot:XP_024516537.1 uncharacterized protein LOC9642476 [Selaginella moellendorffii]
MGSSGSAGDDGNMAGVRNGENSIGGSGKGFVYSRRNGSSRDRPRSQGIVKTIEIENVKQLSLPDVLCDPFSGAFLEDAMVAKCGHSFGSDGLKRVVQTGVCFICAASITSTGYLTPNFALRAAAKAYLREQKASPGCAKRKREDNGEQRPSDCKKLNSSPKPKGVQFPFSVNDRVFIQGNKRTPERFCGQAAIIKSQCLNGWYLVRTVDSGESIRLQYRSLRKIEGRQQQKELEAKVSVQSSEAKSEQQCNYVADRQDDHAHNKSICSGVSMVVKLESDPAEKPDLHPEIDGDIHGKIEPSPCVNDTNFAVPGMDCLSDANADKDARTTEATSKHSLLDESDDRYAKLEPSPRQLQLSGEQPTSPHTFDRSRARGDVLMRVARREMLQFEKLVPTSLLSSSWMEHRLPWRYKVRQSFETKDLGVLLHDFRQNLLLNSAGGMSDFGWESELAAATTTDDAWSLVDLWRKLRMDVCELLDTKSVLHRFETEQTPQLDFEEVESAFLKLQVKGISPVTVIAAIILASANAIARGQEEEEILELPLRLIQQHGLKQLSSIREALEREKRHLTARLTHLESGFLEELSSKVRAKLQTLSDSHATNHCL